LIKTGWSERKNKNMGTRGEKIQYCLPDMEGSGDNPRHLARAEHAETAGF